MKRLIYDISTISLGAWSFGYHIGELNSPRQALSFIIPTDLTFGLVVSIFSVGGLLGSGRDASNSRRRRILESAILSAIGSAMIAFSRESVLFALGRAVVGIAAGMTMVMNPLYLAEISPLEIRGQVGVTTQLSCVIGILSAQIMGVYFSTKEGVWLILFLPALVSIVQSVAILGIDESPRWLFGQHRLSEAKSVLSALRDRGDVENEMKTWSQIESRKISLRALWKRNSRAMWSVAVTQLAQQLTGTNAVIFYSTSILSSLMPIELSAWISVFISLVNLIETILAAWMIERVGRRYLLLTSCAGMALASAVLGYALTNGHKVVSAISSAAIIGSFGIGLGPVPFLLISELLESDCVGTAQSFGLSLNWIATFVIGLCFPLLKTAIGGASFYLFSIVAVLMFMLIARLVPESKGKTVAEVWGIIA